MLDKLFKFNQNKTTLKIELIAGLTTFLTMSYIILVNPVILGSSGINPGAAFVATCIAAAIGSLLMGLLANFPVAIAPSMALNVYFAYVVVQGMGVSWQHALTAVLISGALFLVLTLAGLCKLIMKSMPESLTVSVCAGIGLFIALLALKTTGLIIPNSKTLLTLGHLNHLPILLFAIGFCLIVALDYLKVPGALLIGVVVTTGLGFVFGIGHYHGVFALPPSVAPSFFKFDFSHFWSAQNLSIIFTFFLVVLFDSVGTMVGVLHHTGLWQAHNKSSRITKALVANGVATVAGAMVGTSTTSPYIESMSGVRAGGKTGFVCVIVGLCFILALFFSPLAVTIPGYATAPALLFVGCLMVKGLVDVHWDDMTECVPAAITFMMIPFTFSIADGIGLGFISYTLIKLFCGRYKDIKWPIWILTAIFVLYFIVRW